MRVNFIVEDKGVLKYLGCATAAKNLYKELSKNIEIKYNDISTDFDIAHFHTFGPKSIYYLKKFLGSLYDDKKIIFASVGKKDNAHKHANDVRKGNKPHNLILKEPHFIEFLNETLGEGGSKTA